MAFSHKRMSFHQGSGAITSTEDRRTRAHLDIPLLIITYALAIFGVYCIAIATFNPDKGTDLSVLNYILNSSSASWQAIFCLVSPIVLGFLVAIPYELLRIQGRLVYYGIVGLLILALFSQAISGVTAWIPIGKGRTIQPAEFIKIGIILMMARSLSNTDKPFGTMRNAAYNLGIFLLPTLLNKASKLMSDETLLIVSLGICFGMVLLADALGFSSALGAFLAGSLLAGTVHAERVEHLTSGVKDLFGAVFFISVGMMLDPGAVVKYIWPILILTAVTIVGKLLFSSLGVLLSGHTLRQAIYCGCSLAQIGEFAFIIASLGLSLGVIADYIYPIIISVSVITTLTTPFFIKSADRICTGLERLLPQKLVQQLERYTDEEQSVKEQDSDWAVFLRRYVKRTVFYGVLMLGIVILGDAVLLPLLRETIHVPWISKAITLCAVYLCIAMFIRPMLDAHSPQYTVLWAKKRSFRLPLIALSVIRVLVIVLIVFLPIRTVLGIHSLWLLPLLAAAVLVAGHFGWFASAYLSVETRFLTNFNERLLQQYGDSDDATWLDEKLYVTELICPSEEAGKDLRALGWGRRYGVNIIKIVHGKRELDIPSGDTVLSEGDRLAVLGERENLVSLRLSVGAGEAELPTLHAYISGEKALYTYTLDVAKNDHLAGCTIRDSGLRENYDCMILGLQRNLLPIIGPDVNFVIQRGDLVWLLGSRRMAEKALDDMEEA